MQYDPGHGDYHGSRQIFAELEEIDQRSHPKDRR
jgi:hypothetical protein